MRICNLNFFPGLYPWTPVKRGRGREEREVREGLGGKGKEIEGRGWGRRSMGKRGGEEQGWGRHA
jgi:hypothetical protein